MELSVVIPTHGRTAKVKACLAGLARQSLARGKFEILVGIDGGDEGAAGELRGFMAGTGLSGEVTAFPKRGPAYVRNRLIEKARSECLLLLNDDVLPGAECLEVHVAAQRALSERGDAAMVLGSAPWKVEEPDRLFDRLIRETSMVFFYDRMTGDADPERDWGFRHAWTLNLSLPKRMVVGAGWFSESLPSPRFEDIELAWRMCGRGARVLYRPRAVVEHDHRYEPRQYLEREYLLGFDAWSLARASAGCARAIFGRDITEPGELEYAREFVVRERANAERIEEGFVSLAEIPASEVDGEHASAMVTLVYQQHLLLKRYLWRQGLICASEGGAPAYAALNRGRDDRASDSRAPSFPASLVPQSRPTVPRP